MDHHDHKPNAEETAREAEMKRIAKEMLPYLVHIVWSILIIVFIAKTYAPSTF